MREKEGRSMGRGEEGGEGRQWKMAVGEEEKAGQGKK